MRRGSSALTPARRSARGGLRVLAVVVLAAHALFHVDPPRWRCACGAGASDCSVPTLQQDLCQDRVHAAIARWRAQRDVARRATQCVTCCREIGDTSDARHRRSRDGDEQSAGAADRRRLAPSRAAISACAAAGSRAERAASAARASRSGARRAPGRVAAGSAVARAAIRHGDRRVELRPTSGAISHPRGASADPPGSRGVSRKKRPPTASLFAV